MTRKLTLRNLIGISILFLSAALLALVLRNFTAAPPQEMIEALPGNADLALQEISYTETRGGVRLWTLVADSAAHRLDDGTTRIENIRMTFYDINGLGDLTLTADQGEMYSDSREVLVRGDVVVNSPKGYALYTDRLRYREAEQMAFTDSPVRLVSASMEITGTGMQLDVRDRSVVLLENVKAHIVSLGKSAG